MRIMYDYRRLFSLTATISNKKEKCRIIDIFTSQEPVTDSSLAQKISFNLAFLFSLIMNYSYNTVLISSKEQFFLIFEWTAFRISSVSCTENSYILNFKVGLSVDRLPNYRYI